MMMSAKVCSKNYFCCLVPAFPSHYLLRGIPTLVNLSLLSSSIWVLMSSINYVYENDMCATTAPLYPLCPPQLQKQREWNLAHPPANRLNPPTGLSKIHHRPLLVSSRHWYNSSKSNRSTTRQSATAVHSPHWHLSHYYPCLSQKIAP
jgi:hypothetical protein